jgi:hypothetical protein
VRPLILTLLLPGCATWLERETEHLVLHYQPGSYAEAHLEQACELYENCYAYMAERLPGYQGSQFDVYLHEDLDVLGRANRFTGSIHYRFSEEFMIASPHEMMHIALKEMCPDAPGRLEEGLCRYFEIRWNTHEGVRYESELYRYAVLEPEEDWHTGEVFRRGYNHGPQGNVAAAFVAYLIDRIGRDGFWDFYRRVSMWNWEDLLLEAFHSDLRQVDQDFAEFIGQLEPPPLSLQGIR